MAEEKKGSKLKAKVPEKIEKRLKLFLYGKAGVGKTLAALQFPNAYIIDTEKGTENYGATMAKAGSAVLQTNDYYEIREELEKLLTEPHEYKTLIIDPITLLYQSLQDLWTRKFEKDAMNKNKGENADMQEFGMRFWGKVKSDYKSLQRIILKLDMNVIVTAHQKDVYGSGFNKMGVTFDSMKGEDYFYDLVFRLDNITGKRIAVKEKERAEIGQEKFPAEFEWSYTNFLKYYGKEVIERKAEAVKMATKSQVEKIKHLLDVVKVEPDWIDKVFAKADVDTFEELTGDQIDKCIIALEKKIKGGN